MIRLYQDTDLGKQRAAQAMTEYAAIRWDLMKERYLALIRRMVDSKAATSEPVQKGRSPAPV